MASSVQIELDVLLPTIPHEEDHCVNRLSNFAKDNRGVEKAHIDHVNGTAVMCIHYNDDFITLAQVERLMKQTGAQISKRYQHESLYIRGMHCTDCATNIENVARKLNGVLDISVNYTAEKMRIEYDSQQIRLSRILDKVKSLGYRLEQQEGEKNWLQRNTLLLISMVSGFFLLAGYLAEVLFAQQAAVIVPIYLIAYLAGGYDATRHGIKAAMNLQFDIDFLMIVAAVGAAILGEWAEGALLLFLFSLGHALEHAAMDKARNAIRGLGKLSPKTAHVRRGGKETEIPIENLQIHDTVIVRAGERLPIDGKIRKGVSEIDESPITGESVPVAKQIGADVFAGTVNGEGTLEVDVTRLAHDTTLARVIKMVEEAQTKKSNSQRFAQKVTRIFVPAIISAVLVVIFLPPMLGSLSWAEAFLRAMTMLVGASPCALAISTPSAILAGIAQAARSGVLVKGGIHLENLGTIRAIAFDKTGTLTMGKPEVTDIAPATGVQAQELLRVAASVESHSQHPLARAIVAHAMRNRVPLTPPQNVQAKVGQGIVAELENREIRIGNTGFFGNETIPAEISNKIIELEALGRTCIIVKSGAEFLGVIALADLPREETKKAIARLRQIGISETIMLTGDNPSVAAEIAKNVGMTSYEASLLPKNKVDLIKKLLTKYKAVAMVGDGINDAPAMANATVGIAMGGAGTDVALETADVALMSDALEKLPFAIGLSRQTRKIIMQNMIISLGVIALLIPSALFGVASIGIAIVFHEGSTVVVVLNALRLLGYRR
ncbi:MAG: heavy metal translocating P-type ATPase [bacterium]